jgi:hypothetical protein
MVSTVLGWKLFEDVTQQKQIRGCVEVESLEHSVDRGEHNRLLAHVHLVTTWTIRNCERLFGVDETD